MPSSLHPLHALRPALEARFPEALEFLRTLVGINSHSDNAQGVNENATAIIRQFAPLGFAVHRFPASVAGRGEHLFLDSGGNGPAVALISHLDTVFTAEEEIRNNFQWRQEADGRIFGPGTMDIKGGTAMIWLMLSALHDAAPAFFRSVRWILAWNAEEETCQCVPFGERCKAFFPEDLTAALVFEADNGAAQGCSLLNARKGMAAFKVEVTGRGAHAGVRHGDGANAIWELARVVDRLQALTDYDADLTINVGSIRGGAAHNRVPHHAEAELEIRAYDPAVFNRACEQIAAFTGPGEIRAARDSFPCTVRVTRLLGVPPWPENPGTARLLNIWKTAGGELGFPVKWHPRGGVSDGNWLAAHYPTLDALGPAGGNAHASEQSADGSKEQEYVVAASFIPKAELNLHALHRLLGASV